MLRKMVNKTITITVLLCIIVSITYAQENLLEREVTIEFNNVSVFDAISELNKDMGGIFSFKSDLLSKTKTIKISKRKVTLKEALDLILKDTNVEYTKFNSQIILSKADKKATIGGIVTDKESGEVLIGANIIVKELLTGSSSNHYGFYSLTLPSGIYTISCSYLGYKSAVFSNLEIFDDKKVNIEMITDAVDIEEVVVETKSADLNVTSMEMGSFELTPNEVKSIPILLGEQDILRSVQLMPGVSSTSEGQSGFFVRGGAADQNLILLDEAPVYNATHLMGFFSVFNSDAIKSAKLVKGNSSAEYGGKLSSVMDVKMHEGNKKNYNVYGGIGLISSRLTVEGPIIEDKASFIISGRRTYIDIFLPLFASGDMKDGKMYFYDLNMKSNIILGENDRLYLSGYFGRDVAQFAQQFGIDWGNKTGTLRWNHIFNNKLFSNTTFIYSDYNFDVGIKDNSALADINSGIRDINFKTDFQYYHNQESTFKFGINSIHHSFNPGEIIPNGETSMFTYKQIKKMYALEGAAYISHEAQLSKKIKLEYGARYSAFSVIGPGEFYNFNEDGIVTDTSKYNSGEIVKTYHGIEPRFTMNYLLDEKSSIKLSYSRNRQYLHLLSNSTSGTPIDRWQPSTPKIKPGIADQFSLGYFKNYNNNQYEFSVEVYYKDLKNQVDYKNGANLVLNEYVEADLVYGKGRAYGLELFLRKNFGSFTGWISYTLSRVEKQFKELNDGSMFPAKQDKTHDLAVVLMYKLNSIWEFSATWIYNTGNAVTFPSGKYNMDGMTTSYYTERNGYRMPSYHRLDLGATYKINERSSLTMSLYNAYGRSNAYSINFRENKENSINTEAVKTSLFRFVPSITYNFSF